MIEENYTYIPPRNVIGIYIFLSAMLILGTLADYPISCTLYNESNPIAIFFAAFGECPAYLGLVAAGTMALAACSHQHTLTGILPYLKGGFGCSSESVKSTPKWILQVSGGILLLVSGSILTCNSPGHYLDWPTAVSVAVGLFMVAVTVAATVLLCRKANPAAVGRVALVFTLAILGQLLSVNILKVLWGRPRMRLVASDPRAYFMAWWRPDTSLRDFLTAAGVAADEFKSFPSGHTADGTMAMLLTALSCIRPELEPYRKRLFWSGFLIACTIGFSRIIMGAHYLTDVTVGFLCGFTIMLLAFKLLPEQTANSTQETPKVVSQ